MQKTGFKPYKYDSKNLANSLNCHLSESNSLYCLYKFIHEHLENNK